MARTRGGTPGGGPVPEDAELDRFLGELDEAFSDDEPGPDPPPPPASNDASTGSAVDDSLAEEAPTPLVSPAIAGTASGEAHRPVTGAVSGHVLGELLQLRQENEQLRGLLALVREVRRLEAVFEERGNQQDFRAFQQARNRLDAALERLGL